MITSGFHFAIDAESVQRILPPNPSERFEGIDFSRSGNIMAIATSETNCVMLFKRKPDGRFEDAPFQTIGRSSSGLDYPHDVSFSRSKDAELLAVAQRTGAIAIYEKNKHDEGYGSKPAFEISGPQSQLAYSDGVTFVPPNNGYLAACNLELGTVLFFRRISLSPIAFEETPEFELKHPSVFHPDGLAFSPCGRWLATANHGNGSVSIFQRRNRILSGGKPIYGSEPVTVIQDRKFRYPHSVAFTPGTNHLIVTNAGANYFNVYEPRRHYFGMRWSQSPVTQVIAHDDEAFQEVNMANKREGGPKGVAIHKNNLAVCSPQIGVKIYSFRERRTGFGLEKWAAAIDRVASSEKLSHNQIKTAVNGATRSGKPPARHSPTAPSYPSDADETIDQIDVLFSQLAHNDQPRCLLRLHNRFRGQPVSTKS
jgi:hypothetical protein